MLCTRNIYSQIAPDTQKAVIIFEDEAFDYINDALTVLDDGKNKDVEESAMRGSAAYIPCTYYLKIATDADYGTYQAKGNSLANTYSHVFRNEMGERLRGSSLRLLLRFEIKLNDAMSTNKSVSL